LKNLLNRRNVTAVTDPLASIAEKAEVAIPSVVGEDAQHEPQQNPADSATLSSQTRSITVVTPQTGTRAVQMADTAALERLSSAEDLAQFRFFRSFDYSAALLFQGDGPDYYVALYHGQALWRAFMTVDLDSAEATFRHVQEQIVRLTEAEIRRAQLKSTNARLARSIERTEAQAEQLRNDIEREVTQTQLVNTQEHEVRKELAKLEAQRVSAQAHLNKATRQVHSLKLTNNEGIPHLPNRRDEVFRK
jgi:hypothetical protein